jgi:hypothetical protein
MYKFKERQQAVSNGSHGLVIGSGIAPDGHPVGDRGKSLDDESLWLQSRLSTHR